MVFSDLYFIFKFHHGLICGVFLVLPLCFGVVAVFSVLFLLSQSCCYIFGFDAAVTYSLCIIYFGFVCFELFSNMLLCFWFGRCDLHLSSTLNLDVRLTSNRWRLFQQHLRVLYSNTFL